VSGSSKLGDKALGAVYQHGRALAAAKCSQLLANMEDQRARRARWLLQLYRNEVYGIDALDWEPFPKALVIYENRCRCDTIEDRLTEIDGLADYMLR